MYGLLADGVVLLHALYVLFIVLGQVFIIFAAMRRWQAGRNPWFRFSHLLAIGIVAWEAMMGWRCPLTVWEEQLRQLAGQGFNSSDTFMGRLFHNLLFIENQPEIFFTVLYLATLVVVVQGLLMYPPRCWQIRRPAQTGESAGGV